MTTPAFSMTGKSDYYSQKNNTIITETHTPSTYVRASYYGLHDGSGHYTSSGQRFDRFGLNAAHRSYAFGTKLEVTFQNRSIIVVINDRGPAAYTGRSLDLSYGAAKELGMIPYGVAKVKIKVIS